MDLTIPDNTSLASLQAQIDQMQRDAIELRAVLSRLAATVGEQNPHSLGRVYPRP